MVVFLALSICMSLLILWVAWINLIHELFAPVNQNDPRQMAVPLRIFFALLLLPAHILLAIQSHILIMEMARLGQYDIVFWAVVIDLGYCYLLWLR